MPQYIIHHRYLIFTAILLLMLAGLSACSTLSYYGQAVRGQLELLNKRQPISEILQDAQAQPKLKQQLARVVEIRQFASEVLHLPDNNSYSDYVDLQRPYVVWSIFATPRFAIEPKRWCFPLIGCVAYRGYFKPEAAQQLADELTAQDYDVYIARVAAYSTLGWFSDPVLNTILNRPMPHIAGLIFHELAHQQLYIKDDTFFNEAFAVAVEKAGVEQWLAAQQDTAGLQAYSAYWQRRAQFTELVLAARSRLETLYQQPLADNLMQVEKDQILAQLQADYAELKVTQWDGFAGYDAWFAELNNAKLASIATYQALVPNFMALLAAHHYDFEEFYAAVEIIAALPMPERHAQLKTWQP